jgi:RHS repeat-associated protein
MAMSARASNIGGTLIAEKRNGSRRFHAHDSLGSTIALVSDSSKETDTYTYWPYGEIRTSTGSTASTPFKFCGAWGYYDDGNQLYVRARYLRTQLGRWITRDQFWPKEQAYLYALNNPTTITDFDGLSPQKQPPKPPDMHPDCFSKPRYGNGLCSGQDAAACDVLCVEHFNIGLPFLKCWKVGPSTDPFGRECPFIVCCRCNPCENLTGPSTPDAALKECLRPGEKAKHRSDGPATTCKGWHYNYSITPGKKRNFVSVLCCYCTDKDGKTQYRCKCK